MKHTQYTVPQPIHGRGASVLAWLQGKQLPVFEGGMPARDCVGFSLHERLLLDGHAACSAVRGPGGNSVNLPARYTLLVTFLAVG